MEKFWHLGRIKQCAALLRLEVAGGAEIRDVRIMEPVVLGETTFHLDLARGNNPKPDLKILIKEDPGRSFIFWGFSFLIALLLWYFPQRKST